MGRGGGTQHFMGELENPLETMELQGKIKDLITSTNYNSDEFDGKYMKIKFTSNGDLPLRKTLELHKIIIANKSVFNEAVNTIHNLS